MEQQEIKFLDEPVKTGGVTIIPCVRISKSGVDRNAAASGFLRKDPAAVVILHSGVCRIFNDRWEEISLNDFKTHFPECAVQLTRIIHEGLSR